MRELHPTALHAIQRNITQLKNRIIKRPDSPLTADYATRALPHGRELSSAIHHSYYRARINYLNVQIVTVTVYTAEDHLIASHVIWRIIIIPEILTIKVPDSPHHVNPVIHLRIIHGDRRFSTITSP